MPVTVDTKRVSAGLNENRPLQTTPGISLIALSNFFPSVIARSCASIMRLLLSVTNLSRQIGVAPSSFSALPTRLLAVGITSTGRGKAPRVVTSLD